MKKKTKGYLLFAFENDQLNYGKLAICCALAIKANLKHNNITLVTDKYPKERLKLTIPASDLDKIFDNIIIAEEKFPISRRLHYDSPWTSFHSDFNNRNRILAYKYTPYDETIVIDTDYIMMNNDLDMIWNTKEDLLINHKATDLQGNEFGSLEEKRLAPNGIPMYWATLVFFRKSPLAKLFFDMVQYISDEYNFFQFLYEFPKSFYRNDYAFSIAAHILNGYIAQDNFSFPQDTIRTAHQKDTIAKVIDSNEIIFLSHSPEKEWYQTLVNMKGMNVHIMNKRELLNASDKFIKLCMEKI